MTRLLLRRLSLPMAVRIDQAKEEGTPPTARAPAATTHAFLPRLRELVRQRAGREPAPSAAIIDSQSVKTRQGRRRGFDGTKKVSGRKRHLLVDTLGLLLVRLACILA